MINQVPNETKIKCKHAYCAYYVYHSSIPQLILTKPEDNLARIRNDPNAFTMAMHDVLVYSRRGGFVCLCG